MRGPTGTNCQRATRSSGWSAAAALNRRELLQRGAAGAATVAGLGALAGCGGASSSGAGSDGAGGVIGFNQPFLRGADVYQPVLAGLQEESENLGVTFLESRADGDAAQQLAELNSWIARSVTGITMQAVDPRSAGPIIQRAQDAGIPVIAYADKLAGADGFNVFNHTQGAEIAGDAASDFINRELGGRARIGTLVIKSLEVSDLRVGGSIDRISSQVDDVNVVAEAESSLAAEALDAVETMLQANPDINVIVSVNDDNLIGAQRALSRAGKSPSDVYLVGFDGSAQAMQQVVDGTIVGAIGALPLREIGKTSISLPYNAAMGRGPKSFVHDYILVSSAQPNAARPLLEDFS